MASGQVESHSTIRAGVFRHARVSPWIFSGLSSSTALTTPAFAQNLTAFEGIIPTSSESNNVVLFALVVGAFSFAMMSASWLIRERRRLERDHAALELQHADLRARHEQAQALLDVPDQCVLIWSSADGEPACKGTLPLNAGAPSDSRNFTSFQSWMTAPSVEQFEQAVARLRERAESFDLTLETQNGSMIEAQGRTSGSHAFVRFTSLAGQRAAFASLETEHTSLMRTTDTMKALLEALPMPVWLKDSNHKITWANQAYVEAVDAASIESVSNENIQLLDVSAREQLEKSHQPDGSDERVQKYSSRLPATISGDRRMMDVSEVSYAGGAAGLAVDMSEVEDVQGRLRRTIESHTQTMNQLATAVAIFDQDRRLVFNNQAFQSLWALDSKFLKGEPDNGALFDKLREERLIAEQPDWSKWRNSLLEVYGVTQPREHWWHLPDGRTLRVIANPHKQGGVTWVFENITKQLEMESRYIALTQVQGETLDHLNEAIAVFASDGRLKLSNPSFQQLWQLNDEQVAADTPLSSIAQHCLKLSDDKGHWDKLVTNVTGVQDERRSISGRMTISTGQTLDYAMVPLPNAQNMLSFVDITANVQMEAALTERNEALEAAERLKNAFIEHVSYEFRAPLTNIIGFTDMLRQEICGPLNDKQKEYLDHVSSSSNVLHSMVDNMLDLATVDAGIMHLDLQTVDLSTTVRGAVNSVSELLREQGVKLSLIVPPKPEQFVADATRIQQVLYNLLTNAIRFSPEGSEIKLETRVEPDAVTLRVSDAGPGIPEDKRDTIFNRFESNAHSGGSRGAGLGLAIARSLVELHGGTISLDASVEKGASFVCRLPKEPEIQVQAAE